MGRLAGALDIPRRNRIQHGMMLDQRPGAVGAAGGDGKALAQRDVEHLRDRPEKFVARRKVDSLMEHDVGRNEVLVDLRRRHPLVAGPDAGDVGLFCAGRRQRRGRRFDRTAKLEQLGEIRIHVGGFEPPAQDIRIE